MGKVILVVVLGVVVGCSSTRGMISCGDIAPIYLLKGKSADLDVDTKRQIITHNNTWKERCD